jgi:prophage regulatory protein
MHRKAGAFVPPLARPSEHDLEGKKTPQGVQRREVERMDDARMERIAAVPLRFLRFTTIRERTGLSRSTIWRLERRGAFPRHRRLSTNAVGWLEHEVDEWVESRMKAM